MPGPGRAPWPPSAITTSSGGCGSGHLTAGRPTITMNLARGPWPAILRLRDWRFKREHAGLGDRYPLGCRQFRKVAAGAEDGRDQCGRRHAPAVAHSLRARTGCDFSFQIRRLPRRVVREVRHGNFVEQAGAAPCREGVPVLVTPAGARGSRRRQNRPEPAAVALPAGPVPRMPASVVSQSTVIVVPERVALPRKGAAVLISV